MHKDFLPLLVDPIHKKPLKLKVKEEDNGNIISGTLTYKSNTYPIVKGIPRFSGYDKNDNYTKSFGYQWHKWRTIQFDSHNIGKHYEGHTLNMWNRIVEPKIQIKNKLILDVGCGSGRFIEAVRGLQGKVVGIDLSNSVEVAAEQFQNDSNVLIVQADALNLPFASNSFDLSFSIGVLHHTPDGEKGFEEMVRVTKPKSEVAISVYGEQGQYTDRVLNAWRSIFKKLWPTFKHYPALAYSYLTVHGLSNLRKIPVIKQLVFPFTFLLPFFDFPDKNWAVLDTFDSVTPAYQRGYSHFQIYQWFSKNDLKDIKPTNWYGTSMKGQK